jgi:hypothetical protein
VLVCDDQQSANHGLFDDFIAKASMGCWSTTIAARPTAHRGGHLYTSYVGVFKWFDLEIQGRKGSGTSKDGSSPTDQPSQFIHCSVRELLYFCKGRVFQFPEQLIQLVIQVQLNVNVMANGM